MLAALESGRSRVDCLLVLPFVIAIRMRGGRDFLHSTNLHLYFRFSNGNPRNCRYSRCCRLVFAPEIGWPRPAVKAMAVNGHRLPGAFDTAMPSEASPRTYNVGGFQIATQKLPILKAGPIEEMTTKIGIQIPEMIFGDNFVAIQHAESGWGIKFDAFGALDNVDKTGEKRLKVAYSQEWHASREGAHDFKDLEEVKPFDWSYTPQDYRGKLAPNSPPFKQSDAEIPLELLKRPDPILFFDDVILYEDELADNGIAMLSVKIRVMPSRLLLLSRFFMRLDDVLLRVKDTRVYIDFDTRQVMREYVEKEKEYGAVKEQLAGRRDDVSAAMRDPNQMAEVLPIVRREMEEVTLPG